ncbi:MAG: hypothetical protein ABI680_00275 [Chthoniobacteraceae bacterium]
MNRRVSLAFVASLYAFSVTALVAADKQVVEMELDEHNVYTVPVSAGRITTISFPGPISAIDAALVSTDAKHAGLFQISHTPGAYFLSCKSLVKNGQTNLNVRWNNKTYVLELQDSATPVLSLIFRVSAEKDGRRIGSVTPAVLLGLLDKAKAYPLLAQSHPDAVEGVEHVNFGDKPQVMDFDSFEIRLEEVFRFDPQDTLVFRVTLRNKSDESISYEPQSVSVRVGERVYHQSIGDASGVMPPKSDSPAYFAVTGTPSGGRNELSIKNEFKVLLERVENDAAPLPSKRDEKSNSGYAK